MSPMPVKFRENRPAGSGEDFRRVFQIYGRGGHLACHPNAANKILFPLPKEAPRKIWL